MLRLDQSIRARTQYTMQPHTLAVL
jgi:hypothetical protein